MQNCRHVAHVLLSLILFALPSKTVSSAEVTAPCYQGGLYGDFSWLYLRPVVSDGDFQVGTRLTLTTPPNLTSHILEVTPSHESGFRAALGYLFPCSNQNIRVGGLYFNYGDRLNVDQLTSNQFIQNPLGGGWLTATSSAHGTVSQVNFTYGQEYVVDGCFSLRPFIGLSYAQVRRELWLLFTDETPNPFPGPDSYLWGYDYSRFSGLGPLLGGDFAYMFCSSFEIDGHFGAGVLIGNTTSHLDSSSQRGGPSGAVPQGYHGHDHYCRGAPFLSSSVALAYTHPCLDGCLGFKFALGYELDYFFHVHDRINPDNGYFNNPSTFPVQQAGNLGLGGPFVTVSLVSCPFTCSEEKLIICESEPCGFFLRATGLWLKADDTAGDLTYGVLTDGSASKPIFVKTDYAWCGKIALGYRFACDLILEGSYLHWEHSPDDSVTAVGGQSIDGKGVSTTDASGATFVRYSEASSDVNYELDQVDVLAGKLVPLSCASEIHAFCGVRLTRLERIQQKFYNGGVPSLAFQTLQPRLKSRFDGVGPVIGLAPSHCFLSSLRLVGLADAALLVGRKESTLDQANTGTVVTTSSNNLRMPRSHTVVPIVDLKVGAEWGLSLPCGGELQIEAGYQYSKYFRAINQTFPNFLEGLVQNDSDLELYGPYITLGVANF